MFTPSPRWHKVGKSYGAVLGDEVGFQYQRILAVAALSLDDWDRWGDLPMSFAGVPNKCGETSIRIERRKTQPVNGPALGNKGRCAHVSNQGMFFDSRREITGNAYWRRVRLFSRNER